MREFSIPHSKIEMKRSEGSTTNGNGGVEHGVQRVVLQFVNDFSSVSRGLRLTLAN